MMNRLKLCAILLLGTLYTTAVQSQTQAAEPTLVVVEMSQSTAIVGKVVPQFTTKAIDGVTATIEVLSKEKKYVLICFWASWCQPCRKEIPVLKKIHSDYAEKGFDIIAISVDSNKPAWQEAMKAEGISAWQNYFDREGVAKLYGVRFIPATFLIDATTGMILAQNIQDEELRLKLAELLDSE